MSFFEEKEFSDNLSSSNQSETRPTTRIFSSNGIVHIMLLLSFSLFTACILAAKVAAADAQGFRPPAVPLVTLDPFFRAHIFGDDLTGSVVKGWYGDVREIHGMIRIDDETFRFLGSCSVREAEECPRAMQQLGFPHVGPIMTKVRFRDPEGRLELVLSTFSSMMTSNWTLLSLPIAFIRHEIQFLSESEHKVELYLDMSAEHGVNKPNEEEVEWDGWFEDNLQGIRVGTTEQKVLHLKGDRVNINWGFLHLATGVPDNFVSRKLVDADVSVTFRGGGAYKNRMDFLQFGRVSVTPDQDNPRLAMPKDPKEKVVISVSKTSLEREKEFVILAGYDDVKSVSFYGIRLSALWRSKYGSIQAAMTEAWLNKVKRLREVEEFEKREFEFLKAIGGEEYALVTQMTFRQTLSALKIAENEMVFLKEVSTNGDMNTVDVIYPASTMLLHHSPRLLLHVLLPVLVFANNETSTDYLNPFSPHEIGVYPIADHNTEEQEPMPMENTGNMFLMLLGILQRDQGAIEVVKKFYPLLKGWAKYLDQTLPFPSNQLCTDDFKGKLANNTNLAAKGIVALEAFSRICSHFGDDDCESYSKRAVKHAQTWKTFAIEEEPQRHSKLAYHISDSFSILYNVVWQKLLRLGDKPFEGFNDLAEQEVAFYLAKANKFGTPLDSRDMNVKADWLAWGSVLAYSNEDFRQMFQGIFRFANETTTRTPLMDYYNTKTGFGGIGRVAFQDRPVVGSFYAKTLI